MVPHASECINLPRVCNLASHLSASFLFQAMLLEIDKSIFPIQVCSSICINDVVCSRFDTAQHLKNNYLPTSLPLPESQTESKRCSTKWSKLLFSNQR
mmetsp:Transcript_3058/g.7966  ORF Transcript_3058/g.7966 Transcript_3058/m.7966 type:complete len:98 (-) Transcript_3058:21-314(-)